MMTNIQTDGCKSGLDLKKGRVKIEIHLKLKALISSIHFCVFLSLFLSFILSVFNSFFLSFCLSFCLSFVDHELRLTGVTVFVQGILLRGLHGAREGHWQPLRSQVSQEETSRSQQPGKRNPCPEKVNHTQTHLSPLFAWCHI